MPDWTIFSIVGGWITSILDRIRARRREKSEAIHRRFSRDVSNIEMRTSWDDRVRRSWRRVQRLTRQWNSADLTTDFLDRFESDVKAEEGVLDRFEPPLGVHLNTRKMLDEARGQVDELRDLIDAKRYGGDCETHRRREEEVRRILQNKIDSAG